MIYLDDNNKENIKKNKEKWNVQKGGIEKKKKGFKQTKNKQTSWVRYQRFYNYNNLKKNMMLRPTILFFNVVLFELTDTQLWLFWHMTHPDCPLITFY